MKYTLLSIDWSQAPFSRLERLWAVLLLPLNILQFIWAGKILFCHKELNNEHPKPNPVYRRTIWKKNALGR